MADKKNLFSINDKTKQFLKDYINNASPVGAEYTGQKMWLSYIKKYVDETFTDPYGTAVGVINPGQKFKVVLEAHADEISWFVNYITPEGLINVIPNGGVDNQIAPAKRVVIHGEKSLVKAVFGWPAIHTRKGEKGRDYETKVENLFLDCGARSKEEVEKLGVHVGAVVTYTDGFDELANGHFIGRAFDNRIGGFMIAQVARILKENKKQLPFSLYIVNAVQEEIGLRGAEMIARRIKPDVAIITDVTHDTGTPMINKATQGECSCGKGPALTFGPAVQNKLLGFIRNVAGKNKIDVQLLATSRTTGTDTDSFAYANDGCPSALISIPLRYMHTTVEMLHQSDVENTIALMYHTVNELTPKTNLSYFS